MIKPEDCWNYQEDTGCADCHSRYCPLLEMEEVVEQTPEKPILIFRVNAHVSHESLVNIQKDILSQMEAGVVVLPPYIDLECGTPKDCEIQVVDADGNVVM